jgi:dTDP-4-amino-4,6-dideoxygalactose transaminase
MTDAIPLVDLLAQYESIQPEIDAAIQHVLRTRQFVGGEELEQFEQEFAAYCGAGGCVGVGNGTDALYLILRSMGIGPGDEVITTAHTFIATAESISATGASPVFVDVLPDTLLIDPAAVEAAITPKTRAIVPVHLYGQPCDMDRILEIAGAHHLRVVEDAAQAHGARWRGQRVGSLGDAAAFSFFPGKNLGAYGDAGAVVSNDADLIANVRRLANHGRTEKYIHEVVGVNSRLDGLQAAVLRVKLRHLDAWNARRAEIAGWYSARLASSPVVLPTVDQRAETAWHLYVIRVAGRDRLQAALKNAHIATGVHYPMPLHLQPAYRDLRHTRGSLPIAECAAAEVLSLPLYAELTEPDQVAVVRHLLSGL